MRARLRHGQITPSSRAAAWRRVRHRRRWSRRGGLLQSDPLRMQAPLHDRPDAARHLVTRRAAIDENAPLRLLDRERPISLPKRLMKFRRLRLEAISGVLPAPARGTGEPNFGGHIQNECEFGKRLPNGDPLQASDQPLIDMTESALVDACWIDEAVTDDPSTGVQRGQDCIADMVVAGGREQDRLRFSAERLGNARKQDMASLGRSIRPPPCEQPSQRSPTCASPQRFPPPSSPQVICPQATQPCSSHRRRAASLIIIVVRPLHGRAR